MAWSPFRAWIHDESSRPNLQYRAVTSGKSEPVSNSTSLQGQHYIKNTPLRYDLKEDQTGLPLFIDITVLDTASCAPVENALVELWGSNNQGVYSGESAGSVNSQVDCSSWLRGGLATDSDGIAKFETIYPGPELKRAPRLYAIVRTDWYEVADNKTIDSDSMQYAAAIGQIFFPDDLNQNLYKDPNYKDASSKAVRNEEDPFYKAESGSWKAQSEPVVGAVSSGIRAHVTISLNINEPPNMQIGPAPNRCTFGTNNSIGNIAPTSSPHEDHPSSAAPAFYPPMFAVMIINMMLFYTMYHHRGTSEDQDKPRRHLTQQDPPNHDLK
ncbi:hypothetical protein PCANC_15081 [Puccinia coronata f. sp. avenae]|uniref:Intradiol ring-cleavage dioxygenases domain-containing protein n=1 Tax=Puccinia coronata f. sp. avenae TaxID=200324 RepID=A0A2N5S257_9BASI|nr:hypothetical protein PCASD_23523 [Puccinia coronata f. sp. avenae]PLW15644.1 hypothetical protein PCANC_15108 [Puccinia coronata f. sp. avenae]PLW35089.1 hypothetical protein PCANC_15081 [Puccinia coronata f. sp. avenae]